MGARPLRVCLLAYRGNMVSGGQGVYLWFLARELTRLGHRVDVIVGPPYPDPMPFAASVTHIHDERFWGKWFSRDRSALLPCPQPLRIFRPLNFWEFAATWFGFLPEPFAFSLRALRAVAARLSAGDRWDIVHDVQTLGWGLLGIRALGLRVVTTIHHPLSVDRRTSFQRDGSLREALGTMTFYPVGMQACVARRLDRVFTSSAASAHQLEMDFGIDPERLCMVANGVDTDLFCPDASVARDPSEILCVARASDPNKGVRTLVEALALLPEPARMTLVDEDHAESPARKRAAELGCSHRLRIVGRVSTPGLIELYRRAALVAVPSRFEGFGLPAAEAMACGTPVVAAASGALPEVLRRGGGGILVPRDHPAALAQAIASLLARPAERARLGSLGRRGIAQAYSWPAVAAATAAVYVETLAAARGRPASRTTSASEGSRRASPSSPASET